jgi:hypothetical protein
MNKKSIIGSITLTSVLYLMPAIAFAVTTPRTFSDLVGIFISLVQLLIILVGALSLTVFFWGLSRFMLSAGDEKAHLEGRRYILWGIIALFVMSSAWGLVAILTETFGVRLFIPFLPE